MFIKEHEPLAPKTTMRIGGTARYYAELSTTQDVEKAFAFAQSKRIPLIVLGSGSNTIFADEEIEALIVRITADSVEPAQPATSNPQPVTISVESGKNLPMLMNELATQGLDLSSLTGIPGTVGGAIFGNAGQGPKGIWIDHFVESVTIYNGEWKTLKKEDCHFRYRESVFKDISQNSQLATRNSQLVIWSSTLLVPKRDPMEIQGEIQRLLQRRIETQPHQRTAGSCFKAIVGAQRAVPLLPAWQLIDTVGLRGYAVGDVAISTKHANFLISGKQPTFADAMKLIRDVQTKIPQGLEVEMRCINEDGSLAW